jgi:hypothetical protein
MDSVLRFRVDFQQPATDESPAVTHPYAIWSSHHPAIPGGAVASVHALRTDCPHLPVPHHVVQRATREQAAEELIQALAGLPGNQGLTKIVTPLE